MLIEIPKVLSAETLAAVQSVLSRAEFVEGRLSAGKLAQRVKHNQEMAAEDADLESLVRAVMVPLTQHPVFQAAALPHHISRPFFARYTTGMYYGNHVDDPVMGSGARYRSDLAVTVFLADPATYQGGELVIRTPFGEQTVKSAAGHAVVYPASSLHRVAEVTAGERLVAVAWVQSLVRDPAQRELLYELSVAKESLMQVYPDAEVTASLNRTYSNLVRMWAEV